MNDIDILLNEIYGELRILNSKYKILNDSDKIEENTKIEIIKESVLKESIRFRVILTFEDRWKVEKLEFIKEEIKFVVSVIARKYGIILVTLIKSN